MITLKIENPEIENKLINFPINVVNALLLLVISHYANQTCCNISKLILILCLAYYKRLVRNIRFVIAVKSVYSENPLYYFFVKYNELTE
jgi:hypothetical protein